MPTYVKKFEVVPEPILDDIQKDLQLPWNQSKIYYHMSV